MFFKKQPYRKIEDTIWVIALVLLIVFYFFLYMFKNPQIQDEYKYLKKELRESGVILEELKSELEKKKTERIEYEEEIDKIVGLIGKSENKIAQLQGSLEAQEISNTQLIEVYDETLKDLNQIASNYSILLEKIGTLDDEKVRVEDDIMKIEGGIQSQNQKRKLVSSDILSLNDNFSITIGGCTLLNKRGLPTLDQQDTRHLLIDVIISGKVCKDESLITRVSLKESESIAATDLNESTYSFKRSGHHSFKIGVQVSKNDKLDEVVCNVMAKQGRIKEARFKIPGN